MWGWWSPAVVPDLVQKPLGAQGPGNLGQEHLDRDRSIVLEVIGEVHHGHAALPQLTLDPVAVAQGVRELLDGHSSSYFGLPLRRSSGSLPHLLRERCSMSRIALITALAIVAAAACAREAEGPAPTAAPAAEGSRIEVNGMQMYYEVSGNGDPLIVLHGAYMNIPSMGAIIPKLAETHKVYALESQGHGRTTDIDRPISYAALADDVAAFMDKVGLAKAEVFGYSMGGQVGLQLAIRHAAKAHKLGAAAVASDPKGWQPVYTAALPQMNVEMMLGMPFAEDYRRLAPNPNGFRALVEKLIALEKQPMALGAEVKAIKTPVLIVSGDADVMTLEHSVALFKLLGGGMMGDMGQPLPASRLAILPATSHTAVITQPDLLHALIELFLKGVTPKGMFEASSPAPRDSGASRP